MKLKMLAKIVSKFEGLSVEQIMFKYFCSKTLLAKEILNKFDEGLTVEDEIKILNVLNNKCFIRKKIKNRISVLYENAIANLKKYDRSRLVDFKTALVEEV